MVLTDGRSKRPIRDGAGKSELQITARTRSDPGRVQEAKSGYVLMQINFRPFQAQLGRRERVFCSHPDSEAISVQ
jgi:hypothetical protein